MSRRRERRWAAGDLTETMQSVFYDLHKALKYDLLNAEANESKSRSKKKIVRWLTS